MLDFPAKKLHSELVFLKGLLAKRATYGILKISL